MSPYSICFLSAFVLAYTFAAIIMRKEEVPKNIIFYSIVLNTVLILYGAMSYGVVASGFRKTIFNSGISSMGGAIGLVIGIIAFAFIYPDKKKEMRNAYILVLPLLYSVSKIGCHIAGCCYGIPYDGPFSRSYHNEQINVCNVFPVQILETITFFVIFLIGLFVYFKLKSDNITAILFMLCAVAKFSLAYLRNEQIGVAISPNQICCIAFFVIGVGLILWQQVKEKEGDKIK